MNEQVALQRHPLYVTRWARLFISRGAYLIFQPHRLFLSLLPANLLLLKLALTTHSTFKPLTNCFDCKKRCGEFWKSEVDVEHNTNKISEVLLPNQKIGFNCGQLPIPVTLQACRRFGVVARLTRKGRNASHQTLTLSSAPTHTRSRRQVLGFSLSAKYPKTR